MCQIGFLSVNKLKDHVNFSPLHEKVLARLQNATTDTKKEKCHLLHECLQLFWRIGATLQINIYSNNEADSITIIASDPDNENAKSASVVADLSKVQESVRYLQKRSSSTTMVNFLMDRIEATLDTDGKLELGLKCLYDDPHGSVRSTKSNGDRDMPVRLRRRPSLIEAELKVAEFKKEAKELKVSREYASQLSESVRMSLVVFKHLAQDITARKESHRGPWLGAYNKLHHKAGVLQSRARLLGNTGLLDKLKTPGVALKQAAQPMQS